MPLLETLYYVETPRPREETLEAVYDLFTRTSKYFFDNQDDAIAFMVARIKDDGECWIHYGETKGAKLEVRV